VAIIENDTIVGHVPETISVPCDLFLKKGGTILCVVTDPRQYSTDLEQVGLDVPCKLIFSGPVKEDFKRKAQSLLQRAPKLEWFAILAVTSLSGQIQQNDTKATSSSSSSSTSQAIVPLSVSHSMLSSTPTIEIDDTGSSSSDKSDEEEVNPKKSYVDGKEVVNLLEGRWLQIEKCILTSSDWDLLIKGK